MWQFNHIITYKIYKNKGVCIDDAYSKYKNKPMEQNVGLEIDQANTEA